MRASHWFTSVSLKHSDSPLGTGRLGVEPWPSRGVDRVHLRAPPAWLASGALAVSCLALPPCSFRTPETPVPQPSQRAPK